MKKFFLFILLAVLAVSCSKKVDVKGKIAGGSPMERIEIVDASGVATLPLTNMAISPNGDFSGSFDAPRDGMYVMTYGGKYGFIFLKGGQSLNVSGDAMTFPQEMVVTGEAKKNYGFMKDNEKFFKEYASKVNVQQIMQKDENGFLQDVQKIYSDIDQYIVDTAGKSGADAKAVQWKRDELISAILPLLDQYEMTQKMVANNPSFKVSQKFTDYVKKLSENNERMVANMPNYRSYMLGKLNPDFQKFTGNLKPEPDTKMSDVFSKFLKSKKDLSQTTKDYLLAFVVSQDLKLGDAVGAEKITKIADENISNEDVKKDIKKLATVVGGLKEGTTLPDAPLQTQDGKSANLNEIKGKPTLVVLYASWNPGISQSVPVMKEIVDFYKSKMNFAYINLDDNKTQFEKTSKAMFAGMVGTNYYADGGLNSKLAKKLNIYGFKLPGFIVLDKDGKTVGKYFNNLGLQDFVQAMDKVSGLKAPTVDPRVQMQVGAEAIKEQQQAQGAQPQPAPAGK